MRLTWRRLWRCLLSRNSSYKKWLRLTVWYAWTFMALKRGLEPDQRREEPSLNCADRFLRDRQDHSDASAVLYEAETDREPAAGVHSREEADKMLKKIVGLADGGLSLFAVGDSRLAPAFAHTRHVAGSAYGARMHGLRDDRSGILFGSAPGARRYFRHGRHLAYRFSRSSEAPLALCGQSAFPHLFRSTAVRGVAARPSAGASPVLRVASRYLGAARQPPSGPWCPIHQHRARRADYLLAEHSRRAIDALRLGHRVASPRPGDLVVMRYHVTIFAGFGGRGLIGLGGNQGQAASPIPASAATASSATCGCGRHCAGILRRGKTRAFPPPCGTRRSAARFRLRKRRAVEHAVMADLQLDVVSSALVGNVGAQIVRGLGLADAGNVVLLAFDRHQAERRIALRSTGSRDGSFRPSAAGDG